MSAVEDLNVVAADVWGERYVFIYSDARASEMMGLVGSYASNGDLNFSWGDAATVVLRIRELAGGRGGGGGGEE